MSFFYPFNWVLGSMFLPPFRLLERLISPLFPDSSLILCPSKAIQTREDDAIPSLPFIPFSLPLFTESFVTVRDTLVVLHPKTACLWRLTSYIHVNSAYVSLACSCGWCHLRSRYFLFVYLICRLYAHFLANR